MTGALAALAAAASVAGAMPHAIRPGGINVEPSMRPWRWSGANPDGWWCRPGQCNGVANGTVFVDRELRIAADLGVRNLRLEFPWPLLEPQRGVFDWRRADYIVKSAGRLHVPLQPLFLFTPPWAATHLNDPPQPADLARFVRAVVKRYRASIHTWELWDEPDLSHYWSGGEADYVRTVLVPGYTAIKAADPRARVAMAAPSRPDVGWWEGIYRQGGGASFDIATYHDYSADRRVLNNASLLEDVLRRHGQGGKPIWLGEYGLQEAGRDDVHQAALIEEVLTEKAPIALAQWYALRDDYNMVCCPPKPVLFEPFGLLTHGYAHKQAYATMRSLLRQR